MVIKDVFGRERKKNVAKYIINWDGKSRSKFQFAVKQFLKPYWKMDLTFEEFPVIGSRKSVDIFNYNKKIVCECHGNQHQAFIRYFHRPISDKDRSQWLAQIKRDIEKEKWAELNGFKFIEIFPEDLKNLSPAFFKEKFDIDLI